MQAMPATLRDYPEIEYLDGRAYPKVTPKFTHGLVQGAIAAAIARAAGERGFVVPEVRFQPGAIDKSVTEFVPDVAFLSAERRSTLTGEAREKPPFSPDIAVEVRSPSDDLKFLARKITRYLATGSVLVLDIVPQERIVIAHAAGGVRAFKCGDTFEHPAVPWLTFEIDAIFSALDPA